MAERILPLWVEVWLVVSSFICAIDVSFTMLRPLTTRGGVLEHVYFLWNIYADVDIRYATANDITTMATGRLMIVEIVMDILALARKRSRHARLTAFTSTAFVFWKTCVFLMLYVNVPDGNPSYFTPGTPLWKIFLIFWVPNGVWLVMPLVAMIGMWNMLAVPVVDTENHSSKVALVATTDEETNELSATEPLRSKHRGLNIV